ncbi:MAG: gluconokinase [Bacteroidota bacterium]
MGSGPTFIFFVMGVSGCGKSTIGTALAEALSIPFFDGDDYHPQANIDKMSAGHPLNDEDRYGWLVRLNELAAENLDKGAVIACSALKKTYRNLLKAGVEDKVKWVYLEGSFEEILKRHQDRKNHFMPTVLLQSQFDALEPPETAITISIQHTPEEIVSLIINQL